MSGNFEDSIIMPETIHTETSTKRRGSSLEETQNLEEMSSNSPSPRITMQPSSPRKERDVEAVLRNSSTSQTEHESPALLPNSPSNGTESDIPDSLQTTHRFETGKHETPTTLPIINTTQTKPVIPTSPQAGPIHKLESEAHSLLTSAPVSITDPETLITAPEIHPSRFVSFQTDYNTQILPIAPTGPDKEPSKNPHRGGFPPAHRLSFIEIPGGIGDTPATSFGALVKLWVVVVLTLALCVGLMVAAHLTHSLALRVEAYHSLYNAGALAGSLLSIKLCRQPESLQNTFGWARVDVVSYLISLIFLSSLCFSVAVEAVQTAAHVQHQDPMHYPMATILVAVAALGVNALVFVLIGGYTQHQGSFMEVRGSGEVYVKKQVRQDFLQTGQKTLSSRRSACPGPSTLRQGYKDVLRDIAGLLLTVACAAVVYKTEGSLLSFYIDPAVAMLSVSILVWLSYPFAKECSNILLQTIPEHIDVDRFSERLQESFPTILNVHHLHIWSLRPGTVVSTIHVVFANKAVYGKISNSLTAFFKKEGISLVTLQPEFMNAGDTNKAKCCCSDHLLDGAGDSCDDHAWHPAEDHDDHKDHDHKDHDHKDHDHKHDHHQNKNDPSQEHDHKHKHPPGVGDQGRLHMNGHEDCSEHRQKQTAGEDLVPLNPIQTLRNKSLDEQSHYASSIGSSTTLTEHRKLHENQVHQHQGALKIDISVRHEKITRQDPDHSKCSQARTHEDQSGSSEDSISESSRIGPNSKVDRTNEMVSSCGISLGSDPPEIDSGSVSFGGHKKTEELRKRSSDDDLEQQGLIVCKVGILCKENDGSLDCIVSDKLETKEVTPDETLHSSSETLNNMENSSKSNSSWVIVEKPSSIQKDAASCIPGSIEDKKYSQTRVVEEFQETSGVDNLLNVPKIEITLRKLVVSDEEGNLLFSEMRYASGCPDVEVIGSPNIIRKASSESYLLENVDTETKPRSDSTLSADENSTMLRPVGELTKDDSNFSLTRSVEKLSGLGSDHSM